MQRRLVFFTTADPRENLKPFFSAYHFAAVAAGRGIEAEVRLAGPAVELAQPGILPDTDQGRDIRTKMAAAMDGPVDVTF